jgi:hypothetical protein
VQFLKLAGRFPAGAGVVVASFHIWSHCKVCLKILDGELVGACDGVCRSESRPQPYAIASERYGAI